MFCIEFILHEMPKCILNNLHVLLFLHVVCYYFACYSKIYLLGMFIVGLSQYYASSVQCWGLRTFRGGGGGSKVG